MIAGANNQKPWRGGAFAALAAWIAAASDLVAHHGALDPLSTTLVAIGAIAMAVPRIDNFRGSFPLFGEEPAEFAVNEEFAAALDTADAASEVALRASETASAEAHVFETWLRELEALRTDLAGDITAEDALRAILRFINTRLEDIPGWVAEADEEVRAALWWWSREDAGARIVAAPRITDAETLAHVFHPGEGILGRILVDGEAVNLADAPAQSGWIRIAREPPRYHGLLCLPIVANGRITGILSVDRVRPEKFRPESIGFVRRAATIVKLAALHWPASDAGVSSPLPLR